MKFIKHALIGIALYEVARYIMGNRKLESAHTTEGMQTELSNPPVKVAARNLSLEDGLQVGMNPNAPLTSTAEAEQQTDPWINSLANDELRAPDS